MENDGKRWGDSRLPWIVGGDPNLQHPMILCPYFVVSCQIPAITTCQGTRSSLFGTDLLFFKVKLLGKHCRGPSPNSRLVKGMRSLPARKRPLEKILGQAPPNCSPGQWPVPGQIDLEARLNLPVSCRLVLEVFSTKDWSTLKFDEIWWTITNIFSILRSPANSFFLPWCWWYKVLSAFMVGSCLHIGWYSHHIIPADARSLQKMLILVRKSLSHSLNTATKISMAKQNSHPHSPHKEH
jgi:hypothetical protein